MSNNDPDDVDCNVFYAPVVISKYNNEVPLYSDVVIGMITESHKEEENILKKMRTLEPTSSTRRICGNCKGCNIS